MSKNLTRKGLALGALVALASSLFAAAPAHATGENAGILVAPNKGTTYTSIAGSTFDLSTVIAATLSGTSDNLSYLVTNSAGAPIRLAYAGQATTVTALTSSNALQNVRVGTSATAVGTSSDTSDATTSRTDKAIVVTGSSLGGNKGVLETAATKNHLFVTSSTDATENVVVNVQAFLDANHDGLINNLDAYAAPVSITFIPAANVTATTTITSATIGSPTIAGKVVLGNDINQANLGTDVKIGFKLNGAVVPVLVIAGTGTSADFQDVSFDGTDSLVSGALPIRNAANTANGAITAGTYIAQAYYRNALMAANSVAAVKIGAASDASAPANSSVSADSTDTLEVTPSANVLVVTGTNGANATSHTANATTVRSGFTGNVTFTSNVAWQSSDFTEQKAVGATVKVTLTSNGLATGSSFTAGGKTLTATSGAVSFTVTSDADGKISFTGAGTGKKDDSVIVKIAVLTRSGGYSSTDATTGTNTITYKDAAATKFVNASLFGGANSVVKTTKGGTYALTYKLVDQFGQPVTSAYRATITSGAGTNANFTYLVDSSTGSFTQSVVDNSTTTGNYAVSVALAKYNSVSLAWDSVTTGVSLPAATNVYVNADAATAITGAATSTAAVATITKTLVNADLRVDNVSNNQTLIGYAASAAHHTVSGYVTSATGARVAGAVVTVTGAGLGFVVDNGVNAVYSIGTATINTDATGAYSVDVYSTTAGKTSVVVTSGAATKTVAIEFSGVTTTINTNVISLDVVSLSQVGRAVTVTVKVVDKFGNPVKGIAAAVSVTGVGSLSASTATTASDGTATVQFLAGANDFGDAVITAKYTGVDATGAEAVVSTSKTVTVGVTDAQIDIVGKRVTAVSSFTKGRTVAFYVDGVKKWSKLSASDADVVLYYNLKKGTHTVTVKISGGFVTTEKFIVQ